MNALTPCTFHQWLKQRGIEWPNLGVNMPTGCGWAAAEMLSRERRAWMEAMGNHVKKRVPKTKPWDEYPLRTKAYSIDGGYWTRVLNGWKAMGGNVFPTPGASAVGDCIELPDDTLVEIRGFKTGATETTESLCRRYQDLMTASPRRATEVLSITLALHLHHL